MKVSQTEILMKFLKRKHRARKINPVLEKNSAMVKQRKLISFLSRPHITFEDIKISNKLSDFLKKKTFQKKQQNKRIKVKYGIQIKKEAAKSKLEDIKIPDEFDYSKLHSISTEGKES